MSAPLGYLDIHRRMLARELGVGKVSHWASIRTFAIVTTDANELVADIQTRSPVPRRRGDVSEEPEDQGADQVSHGCAHRCRVSARGRIATQQVILGDEAGEVTPASADFLSKLGVDLSGARPSASLLPPGCGLDRTTTAYRRRSRSGLGEPVLRTEMDRTGARQSRPHYYTGRPPRAGGSLRAFNLAAPARPAYVVRFAGKQTRLGDL